MLAEENEVSPNRQEMDLEDATEINCVFLGRHILYVLYRVVRLGNSLRSTNSVRGGSLAILGRPLPNVFSSFELQQALETSPCILICTMAPTPSSPNPKHPLGKVLVIGGCGFLGHHIVDYILESYTATVSVLDLHTTRNRRPDSDGVSYYNGDITALSSILPIFQEIKPDVVIHTASPLAVDGGRALLKKVNVDGTRTVIEASQKSGVKALVYTSSASIVGNTSSSLINADERWPVIPEQASTEYYAVTKECSLFSFIHILQHFLCRPYLPEYLQYSTG